MSNFTFFDRPVAATSTTDNKEKQVELKLTKGNNKRFEIDYHIKFSAVGQLMTDVRTTTIWLLKVIDQFEDGYLIDVEVEDHKVFNANPAFNDTIDFFRAFNYPTEKLVLKLSKNGCVERVLNQEEVFERWVEIKEKVLAPLGDTDGKELLKKGDEQFKNTSPSLRESFLFNLFFAPFYGHKTELVNNKTIATVPGTSQLFQAVPVMYDIAEQIKEITEQHIVLTHQANVNNTRTLADFKKLYEQAYQELCGPAFAYKNEYQATYDIDIKLGLINSCKATLIETTGSSLSYETEYSITRI
ncbi:hypothetical protein [Mucilaginibacter lacusdianchii]|uniref:hypothetical protein n=1 Tax=Mucilaginibacter lacusdianchii TaxID=2684211 RepID=UPI00131AA2EA|nr:hypothetical protein [Mucilaginibacter sp. JXJ CY 39]